MRAAVIAVVAISSLAIGCGDAKKQAAPLPVVTIWSSMPYKGPQREQSIRYERAVRGALYDLRGLAKGYRVRYVRLDDSSVAANGWDPAIAAANARKASLSASTLAYLGEADSGATAVALPILNQSLILQLTASSTAEGLTRPGLGAGPGAPYQYYPSGVRTLARMVPHDALQGAVIASVARNERCKSLAIIDDGSIYGAGLAAIVADESAFRRVKVTFTGTLDPAVDGYAESVRKIRAGCIVYSGDPGASAVKVITDAARRNRRSRVYGSDALVDPAFADHAKGGIGPRLARRVELVATMRDPSGYPPFGRRVFDSVAGGSNDLRAPNAAAWYAAGELAARCANQVFAKTGFKPSLVNQSRRDMLTCALGRGHRSASIGDYRVHADGDWNGRSYSAVRIKSGKLVFMRKLRTPKLAAEPTPVVNPTR